MNARYRIVTATLLASACLLTPAFAGKVKTVLAKNTNMAQYKTYQWLPPRVLLNTGISEDHPANPILKEVVGKQLALVGLTEVAEGGNLQIQSLVFTVSVPQLEAVLFREGYNFDYGTVVATMGRYNREGTLALNMIDPKLKKSAWAGWVSNSINRGQLSSNESRHPDLQEIPDRQETAPPPAIPMPSAYAWVAAPAAPAHH